MDVDGESTSPGAVRVPAEEQLVRDLPVARENPDVTGDCRHEAVAGSSRCPPRGSPRIRRPMDHLEPGCRWSRAKPTRHSPTGGSRASHPAFRDDEQDG